MSEEPLPQSADPEEDTAALFEAAADPAAVVASASGSVAASQTNGALGEANGRSAGDHSPADFGALAAQVHGRSGAAAEYGDYAAPAPQHESRNGPYAEQPSPAPYVGDSPDLLRWRAEMLLDEMMVGAVDASAGDQGGFFRQAPPAARAEWIQDVPPTAAPKANGASNGVDHASADGVDRAPANGVDHAPANGAGQAPANGVDHAPANGVDHAPANGAGQAPDRSAGSSSAPRRAPTPLPAKGANGSTSGSSEQLGGRAAEAPPQRSAEVGQAAAHGIVGANGVSPAGTSGATQPAGDMPGATKPAGDMSGATKPAGDPDGSLTHGFVLANGLRGGAGDATPAPGRVEPANRHSNEAANDEPPIPPAPFRPPPSVVARNAARPPAQTTQGSQAQSNPAQSSPAQNGPRTFSSTDPYSAEALSPVDFGAAAPQGAPAPRTTNWPAARPESAAYERSAPAAYTEQPSATTAYSPPAGAQESAGRKLTAVEERYPRSTARPASTARAAGSHVDSHNVDDDVPELGPIRRNPSVINHGTITGSMSVASRNSKYAALLPRSTPWDTHEMEREIAALADELTRVLPPGHEASRRAHHLLDKAQAIFAMDPQRSAEVDYYLSQVRAIVQRSRQTMQWSGLYRKRLTLYLAAWVVISGIVVAASLVFGSALGERISSAFGWAADGWAAGNVIPGLLAVYGGALGGALGGLVNMRRYLANGVGFIDRKYSLRGLILPIMGMLAGALIFGVISGLFWLAGVALSSSRLLTFAPALLAFGLGFAQESIYGTRE